jgi:anti-sigma factor RsiW
MAGRTKVGMTHCRDIDTLITRYVDEDLTAAEQEVVDAHVRQCAGCDRRLLAEGEARRAVQRHASALREVAVPQTLRARLAEAAADAERSRAMAGRARTVRSQLVRAAIAASLVLGVGLWATAFITSQSTTVLAAQLAADHVKCFLTNHDHGVLDPAPVADFLRERYDFRATVPASRESLGLRLVGARRCITGEGTNAHILYTWQGESVSLYMLPGGAHERQTHQVFGHATEMWAGQNGTYVLVAPDAGSRLTPLVDYMRQATAQP